MTPFGRGDLLGVYIFVVCLIYMFIDYRATYYGKDKDKK